FTLFGCSRKKFTHAMKIFAAGGTTLSHCSGGLVRLSSVLEHTIAWLSLFFETVGDKMPDGTLHMPILLRWMEVHAVYQEELQPAYTYRPFRACITIHFPKVGCFYYPCNSLTLCFFRCDFPKAKGWA